jgi:hypothetical protein
MVSQIVIPGLRYQRQKADHKPPGKAVHEHTMHRSKLYRILYNNKIKNGKEQVVRLTKSNGSRPNSETAGKT